MSDTRIEKDFEGKEFNVEMGIYGNELWTSVEKPEFVFIQVNAEEYQGHDALDLGFGNGSSSICCIDNLSLVMPIMDKMFLPYCGGKPVGKFVKMGSMQAVCNASVVQNPKYKEKVFVGRANTGAGALSRYWSENNYYLSPGKDTNGLDVQLYQLNKMKPDGKNTSEILELINQRLNKEYMDLDGGDREKILKSINEIVSKTDYEPYKDEIVRIAKTVGSTEKPHVNRDYAAADAQKKLWINILKNNPELAEEAKPFADSGFTPEYLLFSYRSQYGDLLSLAACNATTAEKRKILLQKRLDHAKKNPHFITSNEKGLWEAAKKDNQSANIVIDIFRESKDEYCCDGPVELMRHNPELVKDILPIITKMLKENSHVSTAALATYLEENFNKLSSSLLKEPDLMSVVSRERRIKESLKNHKYIDSIDSIKEDEFTKFAQIYEDYAAKKNSIPELDEEVILKSRNVKLEDLQQPLGSLSDREKEIMQKIQQLLLESDNKDFSFVKNSKQFPNLTQDTLKYLDNPYVKMCINYIENPERENVGSILNRLTGIEAKNYDDFATVVNFVHRRDMCRKVCKEFAKETQQHVDDGQLSYGMAEAGVEYREAAKTVAELFYKLNKRPGTYGSEYNKFYPDALVKIAEKPLEDWMIPVVGKAVENGLVRPDNLGRGSDLFAACKAWKISPEMPKAVAEQIGEMPLDKRMIAGAIVSKFSETQYEGLNHHKELIPEFWKEMSRAQEMPFAEAMKMYIPDTKINRKRFTAAMLEEMGVENDAEKYKMSYKKLEVSGKFEEFLAPKGENKTVVNIEQMVKLAKIKQNKENVQRSSKISSARDRLVEKGMLPESGKFGEGHNIVTPSRDMSAFQDYVSER